MTPIQTNGNQFSTNVALQPAGGGTALFATVSHDSLDDVLASTERQQILEALRRAGGQRASAARMLRISRSRLYRRMDALGIELYAAAPAAS